MKKYLLPILLIGFWACNTDSEDCAGVSGGENYEDDCGVCDDNSSNDCVQDCTGEWGGSLIWDECGVCGGDNSTCSDCNGDINGQATIDDCGNCSGGNTELEYNYAQDCNGVCNGTSLENECGCVGGDTGLSEDHCYTCEDVDGNQYQTVLMDGRVWMAENLRVTRYKNGDAIPTDYTDSEWGNLSTGGYSVYPTSPAIYGNLYNWYAVGDERGICPEGWGIPSGYQHGVFTKELWNNYGNGVGGMMKECTEGSCPESEYWDSPNTEATNELGFNALPSGRRGPDGAYELKFRYAFFWTSTAWEDTTAGISRPAASAELGYSSNQLGSIVQYKESGYSCRCVYKYYDSSPPND